LGLVALVQRAAPLVGCGAVVSVRNRDAHDRAARVAAALAERAGVDQVVVPDVTAARTAASALASAVVCMAVDRRSLGALRDLDGTVLLVGPRCEPGLRLSGELVACVDGSTRAEAVLPTAASFADGLGLELWLLSAVSSLDTSEQARRSGDLLQSGYLSGVVAALGGPGAVTGWDVLHGQPASAIVDHVRHSSAVLVALNSHGASTDARAPLGRVPARVALESPVPVLLTRVRHQPSVPPVPRTRPAPAARRPVPRPVVVPLPRRDGDGLAIAARTFLSPSALRSHELPTVVPARRSRRWLRLLALALIVVFAVAAARAPVPYHRLGGGTRRASELVSVTGAPVDPSAGTILVAVVTAERVTVADLVGGWFATSDDLQRDPSSTDAVTARWTSRRLMADAGVTARTVALRHLGLEPGSLRVAVTPHGLGGPSAGLAMALELVDLLSPGDLTRGHRVAISGALSADGRVEAVGGIRYKAAAARQARADVLLVPPSAAPTATIYAGSVRVVPVATFAEALAALAALP
jgi:PDZ domain-containing protein